MLTAAIKGTVADVVSGADTELSEDGRFLPAIFARKAATLFSADSGGKMYLELPQKTQRASGAHFSPPWKGTLCWQVHMAW